VVQQEPGTSRDRPGVPAGAATVTAAAMAALVDHTLLAPEATAGQVAVAAELAVRHGCASLCVQPARVRHAIDLVDGRIAVCTVVGFPHGNNLAATKAYEAAAAAAEGAAEVDMVVSLGALADGDVAAAGAEVEVVRAAVPGVLLKVIVESALWPPPLLAKICGVVVDAGADMVKTSTGYHPAGGATAHAVQTMRTAVGDRAGVKASGGLRTLADCLAMLDAGANRLGLSATATVLAEFAE
jgi:deoxyribose-phosphate aldolase